MRPEQIIAPNDSSVTATNKLAHGSPRAIVALAHVLVASDNIDPGRPGGQIGLAMALSRLGVRGSSIAKLYDDCCGEDNRKFLLLIRGVELGILAHSRILEMGSEKPDIQKFTPQEWAKLDDSIQTKLPLFSQRYVPENLLWA